MPSLPPSLSIFCKEWREMLRDQRVIFGVFVGPFLLALGLFAIIGLTLRTVTRTAVKDVIPLSVVRPEWGKPLLDPLEKSGRFRITPAASLKEAETLLQQGKVRLVLQFTENAAYGLTAETPVPIRMLYDPTQARSEIAHNVLRSVVQETNREIARQRLQARLVDPAILQPFETDSHALAGRSEGTSRLALIVPYCLMMWSLIGGMTIASDLVAGEKERGTMETLLTVPVRRGALVAGKFLALLSQAWVGLLMLVLGLWAGWITLPVEARQQAGTSMSLELTPWMLAVSFLCMLPYTVFNSSLMFALSTYARNQREAQGYLGLVMGLVMLPLVFSQFMSVFDLSKQWWLGLIPVLNVFQVVHDALTRQLNWTLFATTLASTTAIALAALGFAATLFRREGVIFRV